MMREEPVIDIVQTVGIIAAFLFAAYLFVLALNESKRSAKAMEKLLKGQQRLAERLEGLETLQGGIKSDIADDIAEVRRLAAFLRSAREANDNDQKPADRGNGGGI